MITKEEFNDETYTYAQRKALLALIKTWKEEAIIKGKENWIDLLIEQERKENKK